MARRLGLLLKHYRTIGDVENAGRLFEQLFPAEARLAPEVAAKKAGAPLSNRVVPSVGNTKSIAATAEAIPVCYSPEHEQNPSAEIGRSEAGTPAVFLAAEQWAGGRPRDIRIRKSTDQGLSWPETMVIGDGRPWTEPSLRQITDGEIGMGYVRDWDGQDRDIYFARLSQDLTSDAEFPVASDRRDQSCPSLATDYPAFAAPYIYVAYAEEEGPRCSVKFKVSQDLGASWSRAITISSFPGLDGADVETAVAFDPDRASLHVAYVCPHGASRGIAVATSRNFGATWSTPVIVTSPDGWPGADPKIAAGGGEVVVIYEHSNGLSDRDIGLVYSPDSGRSWTMDGSFASTAADERFPDVRVSTGSAALKFYVSYFEDGARIILASREASAPGSWVVERSLDRAVRTAEAGSLAVLPGAGSQGERSAAIVWSERSDDFDIFFGPPGGWNDPKTDGSLSLTPAAGLASAGLSGGPFFPAGISYTLRNPGGKSISWTAESTAPWVTLSATSGALGPGESTAVSVAINRGAGALPAETYSDGVTFTNVTNGNGSTVKAVSLTITMAGALAVTPSGGLTSTGPAGGPFTPASLVYTLQNTGDAQIAWTASNTQAWTTLSATSGTLAAGASTTVTVSINATANSLAVGTYNDTVTFANTTDGTGNTTRAVVLTVTTPGVLAVTPTGGLSSTGPVGGPFTPSSLTYTLKNTGGSAISWSAAKTQTWTTLSKTSGTLAAGASTTVAVSINTWANALTAGTYKDTVSFVNKTNGAGNTARSVTLIVNLPPALSVTPANADVASSAGTTNFAVSNTGGGTMAWTAAVIAGGDWLSISSGSSGQNGGTITAAFLVNRTAAPRVGIIRVTAAGATGSPKDVTVSQAKGSISLSLSGKRLVEKAWIIQKEYGKLTAVIDNPALIPVDKYVIYRKAGSQPMQILQQLDGSLVSGALLTYNDAFLQSGTSYVYKVAAMDALGSLIGESNEITI